jgi:hypothetical protein
MLDDEFEWSGCCGSPRTGRHAAISRPEFDAHVAAASAALGARPEERIGRAVIAAYAVVCGGGDGVGGCGTCRPTWIVAAVAIGTPVGRARPQCI